MWIIAGLLELGFKAVVTLLGLFQVPFVQRYRLLQAHDLIISRKRDLQAAVFVT